MRSKVAERILAKNPKEVQIFVSLYADIVVRVNRLLKEKRMSQKDLAEKLEKKPSEVSKWLSGDHNFTLRSIAKLEAELGETILCVPKDRPYVSATYRANHFTVHRNYIKTDVEYQEFKLSQSKTERPLADAV